MMNHFLFCFSKFECMLEKLKYIYPVIFPKYDGSEYSEEDVKYTLAWCCVLSLILFFVSIRAGFPLFLLMVPFCNSKIAG